MNREAIKKQVRVKESFTAEEVCKLVDEIFDAYLLDLTNPEILNLKDRVEKLEREVEEVRRDNLIIRDELENIVKTIRSWR